MEMKNALQQVESEFYNRETGKEHLKGIMYQYSLIRRIYETPPTLEEPPKRVQYLYITDGFTQTNLMRNQYDDIYRTAEKHQRYEIGLEMYFNPTGKSEIDGWEKPQHEGLEMKLVQVSFAHIFIRPEHLDDIFEEYSKDRHLTFINKNHVKRSSL